MPSPCYKTLEKESTDRQIFIDAIYQFDQAIMNHTLWLKHIHRTIICNQPHPDDRDLKENAHLLCEFGLWFYGDENILKNHKFYNEIDSLHLRVHDDARILLISAQQKQSVDIDRYDEFMDDALIFQFVLRQAQHNIIKLACTTDQTSGAFNRHQMVTELEQELERVKQLSGRACTITLMEVGNLSEISNTFGNQDIERVLKQIIVIAQSELKDYQLIFRHGGDTFLYCFPGSTMDTVKKITERIRNKLESYVFIIDEAERFFLSTLFGHAAIEKHKTIEQSMAEADQDLMHQKLKS